MRSSIIVILSTPPILLVIFTFNGQPAGGLVFLTIVIAFGVINGIIFSKLKLKPKEK